MNFGPLIGKNRTIDFTHPLKSSSAWRLQPSRWPAVRPVNISSFLTIAVCFAFSFLVVVSLVVCTGAFNCIKKRSISKITCYATSLMLHTAHLMLTSCWLGMWLLLFLQHVTDLLTCLVTPIASQQLLNSDVCWWFVMWMESSCCSVFVSVEVVCLRQAFDGQVLYMHLIFGMWCRVCRCDGMVKWTCYTLGSVRWFTRVLRQLDRVRRTRCTYSIGWIIWSS